MADLKFLILGIFISLGFVLNIVGVVAPCFMVEKATADAKQHKCHAVNPFSSMGSSYDFASFALYTTVVCQLMVALMYGFIFYETKIKKRQYSKEILSLFYYFKWFFLLIVVLIAMSFVLIAIKFQSRFNDNTVYLSYQSLLLITTIIVCSINIALSRRLVVQVARTIRQNSTQTANPFNFDTTSVYSISKN